MWIWDSASQRLGWRIVFLVAAQNNTTDLKHYLFSATAHWKRKLCSEQIDGKFNNTFFNFRSESPPVLWPCTFVNDKFCRSPGNGIFSPLFTASCLKSRAKSIWKDVETRLSEGVENSWLQLAPHTVSLIPTSCSTFTQQRINRSHFWVAHSETREAYCWKSMIKMRFNCAVGWLSVSRSCFHNTYRWLISLQLNTVHIKMSNAL